MGYIRDLEGIKTKDGKTIKTNCLIRSAMLDKPTPEQIGYLKSINLKRVFDLRNEDEAKQEPDIILDGVEYYNVSFIDSNLNGVTHQDTKEKLKSLEKMPTMVDTYISMASDDFSLSAIKKVLREIVLKHEYPTLFHCVTGKDRAGFLAALLEYILGVSMDDIIIDYMKQRPYYINRARKYYVLVMLLTFNKELAIKVYDYYAINEKFIIAAFDTLKKKFGSIDSFIEDYVELSKEDIDSFKERVLF